MVVLAASTDSVVPETEKLYMEGHIKEKLEYRPYADRLYMKLKLESIRKASEPTRKVKRLDKIVHNYKPVSDHKHNVSALIIKQNVFLSPFFCRLNIKNVKRQKERKHVMTKTQFWKYYFLLLKSINITTLKIW